MNLALGHSLCVFPVFPDAPQPREGPPTGRGPSTQGPTTADAVQLHQGEAGAPSRAVWPEPTHCPETTPSTRTSTASALGASEPSS